MIILCFDFFYFSWCTCLSLHKYFVLFLFFPCFFSTPSAQILATDIIGIVGTINIIIDNFKREEVSIPAPALNIIHNYFERDECKLYTLNIDAYIIGKYGAAVTVTQIGCNNDLIDMILKPSVIFFTARKSGGFVVAALCVVEFDYSAVFAVTPVGKIGDNLIEFLLDFMVFN